MKALMRSIFASILGKMTLTSWAYKMAYLCVFIRFFDIKTILFVIFHPKTVSDINFMNFVKDFERMKAFIRSIFACFLDKMTLLGLHEPTKWHTCAFLFVFSISKSSYSSFFTLKPCQIAISWTLSKICNGWRPWWGQFLPVFSKKRLF